MLKHNKSINNTHLCILWKTLIYGDCKKSKLINNLSLIHDLGLFNILFTLYQLQLQVLYVHFFA